MWYLILITCVGLQCEDPILLFSYSTHEVCQDALDATPIEDGQILMCGTFEKEDE
jgi:hypothetical protein